MKKELVNINDVTADMSMPSRIGLGLFVGTMIGVFIPLFAINLTGTWMIKIASYDEHLILGACCVFGGLIGLKMKRLWIGAIIIWTPIFIIQLIAVASTKPFGDWWSAWAPYTRSIGAMVLSTYFLSWYRKKVLDT